MTEAGATPAVDYSTTAVPEDYRCGECGATGVKLWREYQTFSPALKCAECAARSQKKDISSMDEAGFREDFHEFKESDDITTMSPYTTDQIGWYVPAVPDEEGAGYWGYSSVPQPGINWWARLPNAIKALNA